MLRMLSALFVVVLSASLAYSASIITKMGKVDISLGGKGVMGSVVDEKGAVGANAEVSIRNVTAGDKTFTMGNADRAGKFDFAAKVKAGDEVEVVVTWKDPLGNMRRVTGKVKL